MKRIIALFTACTLGLFSACAQSKDKDNQATSGKDIRIKILTSKGNIEATLFASKTPVTVANFLNLAKRGYYNGIHFHRVIPDFMIQGGDPTETGTGNPGYAFDDEISKELRHSKPGIFSMANSGPSTNGSQFFITHVATPNLDDRHTVFGEVTKGQSVVNSITGKLSGPGWKTNGVGDKIINIKILDTTDVLFKHQAENLKKWNEILDRTKPAKK